MSLSAFGTVSVNQYLAQQRAIYPNCTTTDDPAQSATTSTFHLFRGQPCKRQDKCPDAMSSIVRWHGVFQAALDDEQHPIDDRLVANGTRRRKVRVALRCFFG